MNNARRAPLADYATWFDEAYYLSSNPDVASSIKAGHFASGLSHYRQFGHTEGRKPFSLDGAWYRRKYPMAAMELGRREWFDPIDHWLGVGRLRGYERGRDGIASTPTKFIQQSATSDRPVAFMHIPKSAGSSFSSGIRNAMRPCRQVFGWDLCTFGAFSDINSFAPEIHAVTYSSADKLPALVDLILGHFAMSTITTRYPQAQLITIVREPMSRLLSLWLYMRSHTEPGIVRWGSYAGCLRQARGTLLEFLVHRPLASQTDNVICRMLLWPNPLIPENDFIDPVHDNEIVGQAMARLKTFALVDLIENPELTANLSSWFGKPFIIAPENQTPMIQHEFRKPMHKALSPEACDLLGWHSRLDAQIWKSIVQQRIADVNVAAFQVNTLMHNVARYALLMAS